MNTFSKWLSNQMHERNWTQAETARRAGVTRTAISDVISGRRNAGNDLCTAIARAFQMPSEEVFRIAGIRDPTPDDPWVATMVLRIIKLTGLRRKIAERLLDALIEEEELPENGR